MKIKASSKDITCLIWKIARIYLYKMKSLRDLINTDNILTMFTEAEAPVFWPPDAKSQLTRPWRWERLKTKEDGSKGWDG